MSNARRHPLLLIPAIAVLLAGMAGCGNFTTQPYDLSQKGNAGGIPFTLNRPQFTVTRTPGGATAPASYQIAVTYVPDSTQHYVVHMDPALMASIDWTVDFDDSGSLSDTNGKATDQSVAVLTSLASLAGALATAAADTTSKTKQQELEQIKTYLKQFDSANPVIFRESDRTCVPASRREAHDMWVLWGRLAPHLDELAKANMLDSFTFGSEQERVLLETALCDASVPLVVPDLVKEIANGSKPVDPQVKAVAVQIEDRIAHYDRATLAKIQTAAQQALDLIAAKSRMGAATDSTDPTDQMITVKKMATQSITALETPPRDLLLDLTQMDLAAWQARRVATLNNQIQARQFADRIQTGDTDVEAHDATLAALRREKARVLGLEPAFDQLVVLSRISASDKRYKDSQDLIAALQKKLADAEAALAPAAAATAADPASTAITLIDNTGSPSADWVVRQLNGQRPLYVVVLVPTAPGNAPIVPAGGSAPPGTGSTPATPTPPAPGSPPATPATPPATGGAPSTTQSSGGSK